MVDFNLHHAVKMRICLLIQFAEEKSMGKLWDFHMKMLIHSERILMESTLLLNLQQRRESLTKRNPINAADVWRRKINLHKSNHTKSFEKFESEWKENQASGKCDLCVFGTHFSLSIDGDKLPSRLGFRWHVFKNNLWWSKLIHSASPFTLLKG